MGRLIRRLAAVVCAVGLSGCGVAYSRRHVVAPGETVSALARDQGVDEAELRVFNHLAPADRVKPGDVLFLPGPSGTHITPDPAPNAPAARGISPAPVERHPTPPVGGRPARRPPPEVSPGDSVVGGRLRWPLNGAVLRGFGTGPAGTSRGIDIAVGAGSEVRAAAAGRVSYAGRPARAYEPLVILDHPGDRHTVYGNLGRVGVKAGDRVEAGAVLGESGGPSGGLPPHLHFEVRETAEPRDPLLYLPPR